ncbi:hypothetical protein D3C86_1043570 [compost metagenome]
MVVSGADAAFVGGVALAVGARPLVGQVQVGRGVGDHVAQRQAVAPQRAVDIVQDGVAVHQLGAGRMAGQHDAGQGGQALAVVQAAKQIVQHLEGRDRGGPAAGLDALAAVFPVGFAPCGHAAVPGIDRA